MISTTGFAIVAALAVFGGGALCQEPSWLENMELCGKKAT